MKPILSTILPIIIIVAALLYAVTHRAGGTPMELQREGVTWPRP